MAWQFGKGGGGGGGGGEVCRCRVKMTNILFGCCDELFDHELIIYWHLLQETFLATLECTCQLYGQGDGPADG